MNGLHLPLSQSMTLNDYSGKTELFPNTNQITSPFISLFSITRLFIVSHDPQQDEINQELHSSINEQLKEKLDNTLKRASMNPIQPGSLFGIVGNRAKLDKGGINYPLEKYLDPNRICGRFWGWKKIQHCVRWFPHES